MVLRVRLSLLEHPAPSDTRECTSGVFKANYEKQFSAVDIQRARFENHSKFISGHGSRNDHACRQKGLRVELQSICATCRVHILEGV